jgi:hypothetical protein
MANVGIAGHLCPQKRKLVRSLQKAVNKCIDSSCERGHPTTNLLRTSIHTALEVALLDIVVSEIMPSEIMPSHPPKNNRQKGVRRSILISSWFLMEFVIRRTRNRLMAAHLGEYNPPLKAQNRNPRIIHQAHSHKK